MTNAEIVEEVLKQLGFPQRAWLVHREGILRECASRAVGSYNPQQLKI